MLDGEFSHSDVWVVGCGWWGGGGVSGGGVSVGGGGVGGGVWVV